MTTSRAFLEVIAPSVEEAVARGLRELGAARDEVQIEVLDQGDVHEGRQARVRLTVGQPEPPPGEEEVAATAARDILEELLAKLRVRGQVTVRWGEAADPGEERPMILDIEGDDLGMLIGHRGETLAALQYLVRILTGRRLNRLVNVIVDVEGYKSRREQQLRRLAERLAEQAVQLGRTVSLEPMPAYERRIVHLALREHPDVTTESVGEGYARKVTVIPRAAGRPPE